MPMPKPKDGEAKKDFIERCMGNDVMNEDYPDSKQRYAACLTQWKDKDKKSMENEIERRNIDLIELRVIADEDKKAKITGHAAIFNKLSELMWGFREKIAPGAFKKSIEKDDIRALFNHDANYILGRNKAKTLTLSEDDKGLAIEIDPPDTQWARDLQESIRRGDISQMSFGFIALKDDWLHEKDKDSIRTLLEVKLFDVSPVTFPAYPQTSVKVRDYLNSLQEAEAQPELEGALNGRALTLAKSRFKFGYHQK